MAARPAGKSTPAATFEETIAQLREVIHLAQEEARSSGHENVASEHLLLGVLRSDDGVAARLLEQFGVRLQTVRETMDLPVQRGPVNDGGERSLTRGAKEAIILAMSEARRLNSDDVAAAHVLVGLCCEGSATARLLERLDVSPEQVRTAAIRELGGGTRGRSRRVDPPWRTRTEPAGKSNVITCRIDSHDLDAIDALVEAGVRATRSDAAAWLIHVGLEANRGLVDRVYATVAEIRSLRSEAQVLARGGTTGDDPGTPVEGDTDRRSTS